MPVPVVAWRVSLYRVCRGACVLLLRGCVFLSTTPLNLLGNIHLYRVFTYVLTFNRIGFHYDTVYKLSLLSYRKFIRAMLICR